MDDFLGEVFPETLPLRGGTHVIRRADQGMVNIDVFRGVLRIGDGGEQEFADPALPGRAPMNHFVADDEYGLRFHRQYDRQEHAFPDGELIRHQDLPHPENERRRPQERPRPDRQVVPEQAVFRRIRRIHVLSVPAQRPIKIPRHTHEDERRQQPPAPIQRAEKNQRKNNQWQIMRKGGQNGRLDTPGGVSAAWAGATTCNRTLWHVSSSMTGIPDHLGRKLFYSRMP